MNNIKDYNLHFKFIYFNSNYLKPGKIDKDEYNAICLRDAESMKDVNVIAYPLQHYPYIVRRLFAILTSRRLNKWIKLPFLKLFYPLYFKQDDDDKPYCFVIAGNTLPFDYLYYLKKRYPNCRMVKTHRDLLKIARNNPEYSEENMNKIFDLRLTYDEGEAKEYGLSHFDEIESKIEVPISKDYPLSDVFFAGRAKDRLPEIVAAYNVLTKAGLKCDFYITNVPEHERVILPGITYSDNYMPYKEMLHKTVNTRCLLDINQKGAVGYTSRILEAIMYNKRIILNNVSVKKSKYYSPDYMQVVEHMNDIDVDFVKRNDAVDYRYDNDFSPVNLIKQIDRELVEKYGV